MKKSLFLFLALFLVGCQNNADNTSSSSDFSSSNSSNLVSSSSGEVIPSTSSSTSDSVSSSSTPSIILVDKIEASILKENVQVGDLFDLEVTLTPSNASNLEYSLSSSNEEILKIEGAQIRALKAGSASIHIASKDRNAFTDVEVEVHSFSLASLESLFTTLVANEKDGLSFATLKGREITSYGNTKYEKKVSYYQNDKITAITEYLDVDSEERKVTSTTYQYWGEIDGENKVLQKTMPEADYLDGIEDFGTYDSTELYYDNETTKIGFMNAVNFMITDKSYSQLDDTISSSYENGKLMIQYAHEEEKEPISFFDDKSYVKTNVNLVFEKDQLVSFHFVQNKYTTYSIDDQTFDESTKTMKDFDYSFTWNGRLNEALNVNPSDFFLQSFEVKTYADSSFTNEATSFKVGDSVYFEISNENPSNAFNDLTITSESLGGEVSIYSSYYGTSITCTKAGDVNLVFTAAGGASQKVLLHIEAVSPTSITFDSWMSSEVKVGSSISIFTTVNPSSADCDILYEITEGNEFASLDLEENKVIGVKVGKIVLKATCVGYENIFATMEIQVIAGEE